SSSRRVTTCSSIWSKYRATSSGVLSTVRSEFSDSIIASDSSASRSLLSSLIAHLDINRAHRHIGRHTAIRRVQSRDLVGVKQPEFRVRQHVQQRANAA